MSGDINPNPGPETLINTHQCHSVPYNFPAQWTTESSQCSIYWYYSVIFCNIESKIWGFAWWKSVSSRFAVTPCVISTIAKLRYRFWKEPNRTTRISTVAKWEIWFRENHGDFTLSLLNCFGLLANQPQAFRPTHRGKKPVAAEWKNLHN